MQLYLQYDTKPSISYSRKGMNIDAVVPLTFADVAQNVEAKLEMSQCMAELAEKWK